MKIKLISIIFFLWAFTGQSPWAQAFDNDKESDEEIMEIGSWGGKVRNGPGMEFKQIGSLSNGDVVHYLETTDIIMNGYPWIKIRFSNEQEGYKWGGILCGINTPMEGLFQTCTAPLKRKIKKINTYKASGKEKVALCLETETKINRTGEQCIGLIADPCMNDEKNFSTHDMRRCINTESEIWDARLNSNYQKMMERLTESDQKIALRDMQREWIDFSQKFCSLEYDLYKGTMFLVTGDYCLMEMRAKQSIELQSLIDTASLH